jgi:putative intracellular protease/amidase
VGNLKKVKILNSVISDGQLITGQNPASAFLAAKKVIEILERNQDR